MAPSCKWFVVGSLLCSESFFSGYSGFSSSPQKPTFPNSNSNRNQVDEEVDVLSLNRYFTIVFYSFIFILPNGLLAILALIVSKV